MSALGEAVHLPASLEKEALRLAQEDGISLDHWVSMAVAQKVGAVETAAQFFRRRSQGPGTIEDAIAVVDSGLDNPPTSGDELPEGYVSTRKRS